MMPLSLVYLSEAIVLFMAATFIFDIIHYILHKCMQSRMQLLSSIGQLHQAHHDFFDKNLVFQDSFTKANLIKHLLPEYLNQVVITVTAFLFLNPVPVFIALVLETFLFVSVVCKSGKDFHHVSYTHIPASTQTLSSWLVTPAYHALHHIYPDSYLSSWMTLFDRLIGSSCQIKERRFTMTGSSGAFGAPLKNLLEKEGAKSIHTVKFGKDYSYDDYSHLANILRETDVLVLCHGSKKEHALEANCDSFVAIIEMFRLVAANRQVPIEIWAIGSEIELHPSFGNADLKIYSDSKRAFAKHARKYYGDSSILYRHIVPSSFTSAMGKGLMTGSWAARVALFLIKRGFRYVPITYTGVAYLNYLKFLLLAKSQAKTIETKPIQLTQPSVFTDWELFRKQA